MPNDINVASLIISIIILIVVILIIVIICYTNSNNNSNNNSKQLKNHFSYRKVYSCEGIGVFGTVQCCGHEDGHSCTTEVFHKAGRCSDGICDVK